MFNAKLIYEVKENKGNLDPSVHQTGHQSWFNMALVRTYLNEITLQCDQMNVYNFT